MHISSPAASIALLAILATAAQADDLTHMIEEDLARLGYDPGEVDGEATTRTAVAISQFQAEKGMEVTGEATPQLAGILAAEARPTSGQPASTQTPAAAPAAVDPAALAAAQQLCLQEKIAAQQKKQKKKRAFGRMMSAVTNTAARLGGYDLARTASDVYAVGASAADIASAAEDLGLTEEDIAECRNPYAVDPAAGR